MITLKSIKLAGLVLVAGAIAPAAMANNTITLYQGPYSYSDGGEFTAITTQNFIQHYSSLATYNGGFQTFCVETGVEFQPTSSYDYTVSLQSFGAPGYPGGKIALGQPDSYPLYEGTAWLYSQFAQGTLLDYDYTPANRWTDAGILQAAIWYFQGNQSISGFPDGGLDNIYTAEAIAALSKIGIDANSPVATTGRGFGVEILNLGDAPNTNYQNQLVYVPDGGSALMLLGSSLAGLAWLRRKM